MRGGKKPHFTDSKGSVCGTKLEALTVVKSSQWQPVPAACNLRPCCSPRPWQQPALTLGYISWGSVKHRTTCPPLIRQKNSFLLLSAFQVYKDNELLPFWNIHRTWTIGLTLLQGWKEKQGQTFSSIPHSAWDKNTHQYMSCICTSCKKSYWRQYIHKNQKDIFKLLQKVVTLVHFHHST